MNGVMIRFVLVALALATMGCRVPVQHGLDESAANEVLSLLERSGVAARKRAQDGTTPPRFDVTVPQGDGGRALELLRAHGLPRPADRGFEQVYGQPSLIPSPAEERARYLRALSGDLESTLTSVDGVVGARVHLVAEERDPLAGAQAPPRVPARASVLLKVLPNQNALSSEEVRTLIAGSVPGLSPDHVAVVRTQAPPSEVGAPPFVALGPLRVAPSSRGPLLVGVIVALGVIGLMAVLLLAAARRLAAAEARTDRPS